jgi:hypothetical protein
MKRLAIVVVMTSLAAVGQNGFNTVIPDRPVNLSQVNNSMRGCEDTGLAQI